MKYQGQLEAMGMYKHGECKICGDYIEENGKCFYCEWDVKSTPEETAKGYNNYWVNGRADTDPYKRRPKTAEDFPTKD